MKKIIKEWSYPKSMSKDDIMKDINRKKAIGYRVVLNNELISKESWGEQTDNNWIETEGDA